MCMKNLNMIAVYSDIVVNTENAKVSLGNIGKRMHILSNANERMFSQLSMAVFISAHQSKDSGKVIEMDPDKVFVFNQKYEVKIRLTETVTGSYKDLTSFVLDPSQTAESENLCRHVFQHTHLCCFDNVTLPVSPQDARERFVIKLLIRRVKEDSQDTPWVVQSIHPIETD